MLVSYSDSEGSEDEQPKVQSSKPALKTAPPASNFAIDKSSGKIRVNLQSRPELSESGAHEDEPAAKRPRLGAKGGPFSNFNAMLPAPKRDNLPPTQNGGANKAPARKVFSLRTGAEPAFSRESDAELREIFSEQGTNGEGAGVKRNIAIPSNIPKPSFAKPAPPAPAGQSMMFKPLSVSRNMKKKKPAVSSPPTGISTSQPTNTLQSPPSTNPTREPPPKKKINLFSADPDSAPIPIPIPIYDDEDEDEIIKDLGPASSSGSTTSPAPQSQPQPQSLASIANDLNLSASERRQLLGRHAQSNSNTSAHNIVNFNTDAEYAANQAMISAGETVSHNPVRSIAGGKHSLRQLVSSAATQKEALEESFAAGKRNKREAGNKYGW